MTEIAMVAESSKQPPNSITEVLDKFHDSISRVFDKSLTHPNVIIGGDFNLGDIDWASDEPAPRISNSASQHNKFLHLIEDFSLSQHIKSTTRPASDKILDLLLSTYPNSVLNPTTVSGISDHLAVVFEKSFDHNAIPTDWSQALVTAVLQNSSKSNPANYRPISLTCIWCKIMEHIVLSHMAKHLSANNILIAEQHGFRKNRSCETQLISTIHDWGKSINLRNQTDVILLDFKKAFDSVPHEHLLTKLDYYGIKGNTRTWIKAFITKLIPPLAYLNAS
ncbi:Hypothetical predicted protein [Paramuricea clavata]|uniref:Uncharacterized protein n=1 Tax=Paramuricea clavata TaxID=317549 RepID=A0A7D9IBE6_PARCT|nr:Hypothetical predicted protein [Paramuricea clavata]